MSECAHRQAVQVSYPPLTEGISAQFRWNVYLASGYTRATELATGPFQLASALSANGSLRSSPYVGQLPAGLPIPGRLRQQLRRAARDRAGERHALGEADRRL